MDFASGKSIISPSIIPLHDILCNKLVHWPWHFFQSLILGSKLKFLENVAEHVVLIHNPSPASTAYSTCEHKSLLLPTAIDINILLHQKTGLVHEPERVVTRD